MMSIKLLLSVAAISLVIGCASTGRHVTDWGEIDLAPGDTGSCQSNPCRVFFQMPPGEGSYTVTGNGIKIGDFPAGKRVSIGSFFENNSIKLPGTDLPPTYLYVPETSSSNG